MTDTTTQPEPLTDGLLPCPFCGRSAHPLDDRGIWTVQCSYCQADSGYSESRVLAIATWNRRTTTQPAEPLTDAELREIEHMTLIKDVPRLVAEVRRLRDLSDGYQREADRLLRIANEATDRAADADKWKAILRRLDQRFGCGHVDHGPEDAAQLIRHVDELLGRVERLAGACEGARDVLQVLGFARDDGTQGGALLTIIDADLAAPPAVASDGWTPVTPETMPPVGEDVLWGTTGNKRFVLGRLRGERVQAEGMMFYAPACFTHWQLPPAPPVGAAGDAEGK